MFFEVLKNKTLAELYKLLEDRKKEQLNMRIQMRTSQEFKAHRIKEVRRDIAKIQTRIVQKKSEGVM
ncbi:MAG: 50S ribosomal protein L29 [Holosporales bacterium]|jgi:large subunit ribosomal protein L29|nr:50S ribosomal protein L29 [Holosporales bacterium]